MAETRRRRYFQMPAIDQPDPEPNFQHTSDEFVVPATDEDGASTRCQFTAPAQLMGWAADIVNSRKFPFRRDGDLMRYGLYLACCQLARIEREVPSLQSRIDAAAMVVRRRTDAAKIAEHLDAVAQLVSDLQKRKAYGEIFFILASEHRLANEIVPSEPYWGQVWLDGLVDRFSDIKAMAESKLEYVNLAPRITPATPDSEENAK